MKLVKNLSQLFTVLLLIAACTTPVPADNAVIKGSVSYRERILPPPGTMLQVSLNDISLADAPSVTLAEQRISMDGRSVPVDYVLSVPKERLQAGRRYAVRAEIRAVDRSLLWTTDTVHGVDATRSTQTLAPIMLVKTGNRSHVTPGAAARPGLTGAEWQVEDLNGTGVIDNSPTRIRFSPDGKVSGNAGCNRFSGDYSTRNGTLTLGSLSATERACIAPALNAQEARFLELMQAVDRYTFDATGALILKTRDGRTITARAG
ncbi:MAG: META domain-containing protein [Thiothrix sp.]|nr:META domain-containing protein [Thiothrix sp.]HPQ94994.1 META domain-containing protein [Thiolinea sp.]